MDEDRPIEAYNLLCGECYERAHPETYPGNEVEFGTCSDCGQDALLYDPYEDAFGPLQEVI